MELNNLFLSYMAGFIDAEGSFTTVMAAGGSDPARKYIRGQLDIRSMNPFILEAIKTKIDGFVYPTKKEKSYHKQSYMFSLHGPRLLCALPLLSKRLVIKRSQAVLLWSLMKTKRTKSLGWSRPLEDKTLRIRKAIASKLRRIKKKDYDEVGGYYYEANFSKTSPEERAYIAGFLDGDGRVALEKGGSLRFSFYNNNPKVLLWIQKRVGGRLTKQKKRKSDLTQPYKLYVPLSLSLIALPLLFPYLCIKKEIAKLCIKSKQTKSKEEKKLVYRDYRRELDNSTHTDCTPFQNSVYRKEKKCRLI